MMRDKESLTKIKTETLKFPFHNCENSHFFMNTSIIGLIYVAVFYSLLLQMLSYQEVCYADILFILMTM